MNRLKKWFLNLSFEAYLGGILMLGFLVWLLNLYIPTLMVTYVFSWLLVGTIAASVLGMIGILIYKTIKEIRRK